MQSAQFDPEAFGTAVGKQIRDAVAPLLQRIEFLEQRPLRYDGPHESGKVYERGMFVTFDGSIWHANYKTASRPGDGPAWTLAVKKGRDAR